jgi:hypothetical protein
MFSVLRYGPTFFRLFNQTAILPRIYARFNPSRQNGMLIPKL